MTTQERKRFLRGGYHPSGVRGSLNFGASMFDFAEYRREVASAEAADEHRRLVDDTKKRAVYQAENYDQFKNLVATCHLRPLDHWELQRNSASYVSLNKAVKCQQVASVAALPREEMQDGVLSRSSELLAGEDSSLRAAHRCAGGIRVASPLCEKTFAAVPLLRTDNATPSPCEIRVDGNMNFAADLKHGLDAETYLRVCREQLRLNREDSLRRLASLPPVVLQVMFKVEFDPDLLLEVLETLSSHSRAQSSQFSTSTASVSTEYPERATSNPTTTSCSPKNVAPGHHAGTDPASPTCTAFSKPLFNARTDVSAVSLTGTTANASHPLKKQCLSKCTTCDTANLKAVRERTIVQQATERKQQGRKERRLTGKVEKTEEEGVEPEEEGVRQEEAAEAADLLLNLSNIPTVRRALVLLSEEERQKVQLCVDTIIREATRARLQGAPAAKNRLSYQPLTSWETQKDIIAACFSSCGRQQSTLPSAKP